MAGVDLVGLEKRYGATRVLERVDLSVRDGEYIVLLGRSGCGKSTMLRCIAGLEDVSAGEIRIGGERVDQKSPKDRDIAMVFQSYALYPHMTVRDNMGFALKIAGKTAAEIAAAVGVAAEMLALVPLLDRLPAQLSGGQRQRVAMGRAIVRRPKVFLFDEPLSNLDAALRSHMRLELKRLHKRLGATILHVTHDQVEAMTLGDRMVLLDKGVVQQIGSPREVFDTPANVFVAGFIGSPAMNLLPATGYGATSRFDGLSVDLPVPAEGPFTLGVRPSDIALGASPLSGRVELVESFGDEAYLHVEAGPLQLVVRATASHAVGDTVSLVIGRHHRFHATTGLRLS